MYRGEIILKQPRRSGGGIQSTKVASLSLQGKTH